MTPRRLATAAPFALTLVAPSAQAAILVYDPTNYAKLLEQAQTALDQLNQLKAQVQQGEKLFDSLNQGSSPSSLATALNAPDLRQVLPQVGALSAAAKGDLSQLGAIGTRAGAIRAANRLYTPPPGDPLGADLEATGQRAARDQALGEAVSTAGAQRLAGLETLQAAIDAAPNARAVLDLQARAATEQAMIANDQMRLQGLAMAQAAEARLQAQRERERLAAEAASDMAFFKRSFQ